MDFVQQDKKFPLKRNSQSSVMYAVVLGAVIICFVWFLLLPKFSAVSAAKQQQQELQAAFQDIEQDKQTFNQLLAKLHDSPKDVAILDEALPLDARVSKLELLVSNLVGSSGMKLVTMAANLPVPDSSAKAAVPGSEIAAGNKQLLARPFKANRQLKTTQLTATVSGNTDQFKGLLRLIETSPRILDVESFDLAQDKDGLLTFRLRLKAYSYAP